MKALILGAEGQLGRELVATAPNKAQLVTHDRSTLDICDPDAVSRVFTDERPNVVFNAAAYTAVDKAESDAKQAFAVNAQGAVTVASACASVGARLVHFSTDFVFDGAASEPYCPDSPTAPLGVYGRSKLDGERAVIAALPDTGLVVRTSWLYSEHGHNFVKTMLRLMAERDSLSVVGDQLGSPTWANGLACVAWRLVEKEVPAGIYHWSDAGETSWYDFAVGIQGIAAELGLLARPVPIEKITATEYPTPAKRPAYSVLDVEKTVEAAGCEQIPWQDNLRAMLKRLKNQC